MFWIVLGAIVFLIGIAGASAATTIHNHELRREGVDIGLLISVAGVQTTVFYLNSVGVLADSKPPGNILMVSLPTATLWLLLRLWNRR